MRPSDHEASRGGTADTDYDVAIVGAGPAGLGAAYRLAGRGHRVVVLDGSSYVGGLSASFEVAGVRVDHGSHRLHPATPAPILADLRRLLGDELQTRPRHGRIRLFDRWVDFPLRPMGLARALPPRFLASAAASAAVAATRSRRSATFAEHVSTGLGTVMGREFYFPYARKIWGVEPDRIAGEQARRRITAASPAQLLSRITAGADASSRSFYYPAGGFGRIAEELSRAATAAGADLMLASPVRSLRATSARTWELTSTDVRIRASRVWSSVPVTTLARLLGRPAPALRHRSMVLVYLVVSTAQRSPRSPGAPHRYTEYDAHYLPSADTPITRISEPANYRDSPLDPRRHSVLCAELPCDVDDRWWSAPDSELAAAASNALRGAGLPLPRVIEAVVRRIRHAYPVYELGYAGALDDTLAEVDALPGLLTFGRQGLFAHDNTHHALAMAWAAADCLRSDGSFDDRGWLAARARFAEHVVQD